MAGYGFEDKRPLLVYQLRWRNGDIEVVQAKGVVHEDSGNIAFWRDNIMILSVSSAEVSSVRLMQGGGF